MFVCLFVSSNLAVVGGEGGGGILVYIGRENLENHPAGCIVNHVYRKRHDREKIVGVS